MMEEWKKIPKFKNYLISNLGRVKSKGRYVLRANRKDGEPIKHWQRARILRPRKLQTGYLRVSLSNNLIKNQDTQIGRLVGFAFVKGYFRGAEINHKDFDKSNNRWWNLEWVTRNQNMEHLAKSGRLHTARLKDWKNRKDKTQPSVYEERGILEL